MGIVVYCPNGHRVKVKDEFAGKKVHCPTCQAKTRVPLAPPPAAPDPVAAMPASGAALPTAQLVTLPPAAIAALPRAHPFFSADAPPFAADLFAEEPPAALPAFPSTLHPALAERPELLWRIAHPGGEPSEPTSAESMQAWLEAHQAVGSELVWRSDWPGWIPARDVFPDHFA